LFFNRDWADGAGPTVEPVIFPAFPAEAVVLAPRPDAGWEVEVEWEGCAPEVAGFAPKRLGAVPDVAVAPDAGVAELWPPRLGKGVAPAVVVGGPLVADVVPLLVADVSGVDAGGLPQLNEEPPVAGAVGVDPVPAKSPPLAGAEDAGAVALPPKDGVEVVAAGVEPSFNSIGFAGVDEGVELERAPKSPVLGVACASCVAVAVPPPNRPPGGAEEAGVAGLFASEEAPMLPKSPDPGVELPRGFAAELLKRVGAAEEGVDAGFWACANSPPGWLPAPAWVFC